jgi:hypothetical protein
MKYCPKVEDWFPLVGGKLRHQCCDCGLIHDVEGRKINREIELRFKRNERATAACRKHKKKKVLIIDE